MIKLASLIEWKKYSVPHHDPDAASNKDYYLSTSNEPWRGPHAGAELELMLKGKKPVASIGDPKLYKKFLPYINQGRFVSKKDPTGGWVISQPDETWRIDKIIKLFHGAKGGSKYHAMLGILLGYSKEDIRKFIADQKKKRLGIGY